MDRLTDERIAELRAQAHLVFLQPADAIALLEEIKAHRRALNKMPQSIRSLSLAIAERHNVSPDAIFSRTRSTPIVRARWEIWWTIRQTFDPTPSYPRIGAWFGFDHSSIIHGVREYRRLRPHVKVEALGMAN